MEDGWRTDGGQMEDGWRMDGGRMDQWTDGGRMDQWTDGCKERWMDGEREYMVLVYLHTFI